VKAEGGQGCEVGDEEALLALIAELSRELNRRGGIHSASLESDIDRDLGLDSLARIELAARIEVRFGIVLEQEAAFSARTPADLLGLMAVSPLSGNTPLRAISPSKPRAEPGHPAADAKTLVEALEWHVHADADRIHAHFVDEDTGSNTITYGELWSGASRVAAGLASVGFLPGERAVIMLPTGRDYFLAFFGIMLAGGIAVPIYPPARRSQLEDHLKRQSAIVRNAQGTVLVTTPEATGVARLLTAQITSLRTVTTVRELGLHPAKDVARPRPDDIGFLQYTSGSTGDPKGVILSHANLMANVRADGIGLAVQPNDVFVSWLPLYHDMGLIGAWFGSLYHGIPLVIMSPLTFLARPQRWLWAIDKFGGTLSAAPNFAYDLCVRRVRDVDVDGLDLSSWRLTLNGAEAISPRTMSAFSERFSQYGLSSTTMLPVYGLAECAVGLAFSPLGRRPVVDTISRRGLLESGRANPVSGSDESTLDVVACGLPLPGHELRVVDDADREVSERMQGRLQFRGPSATSGYFAAPEATLALIRDGWLETGDLAYIAAGEVHITGRSKDLIIRAGRNIHPVELEEAISSLDGVRAGRVAAFGSVDTLSGTERLVVIVETRWRETGDLDALRQAISRVSNDLVGVAPDDVAFAPPGTVLRTSSGKIRRAACREVYEGGRIGERPPSVALQVARLALSAIRPQLRRGLSAFASYAWAGIAWLSFVLLALATFGVLMLPIGRRKRWRLAHFMARGLMKLVGLDLSVTGSPVRDRAVIYVSNHQSYLDGFVALAAMPEPVAFLAKAELVNIAPVRLFLEKLGTRFVRRFDPRAAIADLREAVTDTGTTQPLFIFPEGTFKRMPGLLPFHLGAFVAAKETGSAIVPIAIRGTRSVLREGSWFLRRGAVEVRIGAPLIPETHNADATSGSWRQALALRDSAREWILSQIDEPDLDYESNQVRD
jgi:1-acyl-sn-glycerol-3-phosphate acyltransferase